LFVHVIFFRHESIIVMLFRYILTFEFLLHS